MEKIGNANPKNNKINSEVCAKIFVIDDRLEIKIYRLSYGYHKDESK